MLVAGLLLKPDSDEDKNADLRRLLHIRDFESCIAFLVGIAAFFGNLLFLSYTSFGFGCLPVNMMKPARDRELRFHDQSSSSSNGIVSYNDTVAELVATRDRLRALATRISSHGKNVVAAADQRTLDDFERRERFLMRRLDAMDRQRVHWLRRVAKRISFLSRPMEIVFGFFCLLWSLLIVSSLILHGIHHVATRHCNGKLCETLTEFYSWFYPMQTTLLFLSKVLFEFDI